MREFILNILFPKRCVNCGAYGKYICDNCFVSIRYLDFSKCTECMKPSVTSLTHPMCSKKLSIDGVFATVEYKTTIKKAVYSYKYEPYIFNLSEPFSRLMYESMIQNEIFQKILSASDNVWITCVPLHENRLKSRGYNQSAMLGKMLSEKMNMRFNSKIIKRVRDTIPQFKLSKEERVKNIAGAFQLNSKYKGKMRGKTILLVDDVFTSGSTMRECGKLLKKSGAKAVYGLVLAMEQ